MSIYPGIDDERVVRVPGQTGPGYKISSGSKISFSNTPAGTLQIIKREDGVISTVESSFAGGTLELTDADLLDAKIVDDDENILFQLGDMVGSSVFDPKGGLVGTASGNVYPVQRKAVWALEFDGTGYVDCGNDESLDFGTSDFSIYLAFSPTYKTGSFILRKGNVPRYLVQTPTSTLLRIQAYDGSVDATIDSPLFDINSCVAIFDRDGYLSCYNQGKSVGSVSMSGVGNLTNSYDLVIGVNYDKVGFPLHGFIYLPVIIYARALSEEEIKLLTQRQFDKVSRDGLVLWVDVDPLTGQLVDRSPYNHTLTMYGGVQVKKVML